MVSKREASVVAKLNSSIWLLAVTASMIDLVFHLGQARGMSVHLSNVSAIIGDRHSPTLFAASNECKQDGHLEAPQKWFIILILVQADD